MVHIYKCREGFDYEGNTEIDSTCEEGSGWTNLDAECIGGLYYGECRGKGLTGGGGGGGDIQLPG